MKLETCKFILCWTLSLTLGFLPAVRLKASPHCDNAVVARVLFDYLSTRWLSEDSLAKLASLSVRELHEMHPIAELDTIKEIWKAIQLMDASETARLEGIAQAKEQFIEAVNKDKQFIDRLTQTMQRVAKEHKTELSLVSLSDRFDLMGTDRITNQQWSKGIQTRLETINFSAILHRYLGEHRNFVTYFASSANALPFRRWMIANILHPSEDFYTLFRGAIEDIQFHPRGVGFNEAPAIVDLSDAMIDQLARSLYEHINHLWIDLDHPDLLLYTLFNRYAHQLLESSNTAHIAARLAEDLNKVDPTWRAARLSISQQTPEPLQGLIPVFYTAKNQISAASTGHEFIEAILFYDIVTNPPDFIKNRLKDPEAFTNLVSSLNHLRFGGHIHAGPPHHSISSNITFGKSIALGLVLIQSAYVIAHAGGLVPLPTWLLALMSVYAVGIRPVFRIRP
jgi:hypothetical protein